MKSIYDYKIQLLVEAMSAPPPDPAMAGTPVPQTNAPTPPPGQEDGGNGTQLLMAAWTQLGGQANAKTLLDFVKQARQAIQKPAEQPPQTPTQGQAPTPPPGQTGPF